MGGNDSKLDGHVGGRWAVLGLAFGLYRTYRAFRPREDARRPRDEGASLVEYGLLVALIAVAIVGAIFGLGSQIGQLFDDAKTCIQSSDASCNQ
jgi:Flp pilus assembly pilin Flp